MAATRKSPSPPWALGLLLAAGLLVGARAVQLAVRDFATADPRHAAAFESSPAIPPVAPCSAGGLRDGHASPAVHPPAEPVATSVSQGAPQAGPTPAAPIAVRRLPDDAELQALLSMACAPALELIEREGLPHPADDLAHEPAAASRQDPTKTPLRVAMRPTPAPVEGLRVAQRGGQWLVSPDSWFVPEDREDDPVREPVVDDAPVENEAPPTAIQSPPAEADPAPAHDPVRELPPTSTPVGGSPGVAPALEFAPDAIETPGDANPAGPFADPAPAVEAPSLPEPSPTPQTKPDAPTPPEPPVRRLPAFDAPSPPAQAEPSQEPVSQSNAPLLQSTTAPNQPPASPAEEIPAPPAPTTDTARRPITPAPLFAAPNGPTSSPTGGAADPATGAPHSLPSKDGAASTDSQLSSIQAHRDLFAQNCYPSAQQCGECHKKLYDEWRVSSHAYAFVSPMFQKFEQRITDLSRGTVGYFCYRCHSPVATSLGENRVTPPWDMPAVAREGVTCVACHRVNERYTKANGERRIVPGDIYAPVYGGIGGEGVAEAIARPDHYKVKTSPAEQGAGQAIHLEGRYFDQLGKAEFCTSCHQVAVHPGIKLEVVWEQYRQSPAFKKGVTCQDCHMGLKPGEASGYEVCSIAEVGGKSVNEHRKHANHMFYGPNYSISHPGVFPHNKDAQRWTMPQWLAFDWRAGWGADEFEDAVHDGRIVVQFPPEWREADDRYDAREVIDDNLKALEKKNEKRREIMTEHMHVAGPFFHAQPSRGAAIRLYYDVTNLNEGHNVLTASLGAQPQLWANVVLIGPRGQRLWESGYTDSDGDLCDIHSRDVQLRRAPFDHQLFNLQTMFLITGAVGTDREMPLPVNVDIDQLPFLRPGAIPITTTNHPPFIRMESRSIAPLGTKRVHYKIPAELVQAPGRYRLSFRLRNRIEPIWFMRFCNATDEMVRMMNEGILDMHERSVEFEIR